MGNIFTEILSPIYEEHPDLAPDWHKNGERKFGAPSEFRMSKPMQYELVKLMGDVYQRIESLAGIVRAGSNGSDGAEIYLCLSRVHEVLLHVAAAKADLLFTQAKDDSD